MITVLGENRLGSMITSYRCTDGNREFNANKQRLSQFIEQGIVYNAVLKFGNIEVNYSQTANKNDSNKTTSAMQGETPNCFWKWTPDGTLYIKSKNGKVDMYDTGQMLIALQEVAVKAKCMITCSLVKRIELSSGIKEIGNETFTSFKSMQSVELPEGLISIGAAFVSCNELIGVKIPESVQRIAGGCFSHCKKLEHVKLPSRLPVLEPNTFLDCGKLTKLEVPRITKVWLPIAPSNTQVKRV